MGALTTPCPADYTIAQAPLSFQQQFCVLPHMARISSCTVPSPQGRMKTQPVSHAHTMLSVGHPCSSPGQSNKACLDFCCLNTVEWRLESVHGPEAAVALRQHIYQETEYRGMRCLNLRPKNPLSFAFRKAFFFNYNEGGRSQRGILRHVCAMCNTIWRKPQEYGPFQGSIT